MLVGSKRRLYTQIDNANRFDVQLVRLRFADEPRLLWGVDATYQMKYTRHNVPHPAYFRFRRVHPSFYRRSGTGKSAFIDKFAGRNKVKEDNQKGYSTMIVAIELAPEIEQMVRAKAEARGISVEEYLPWLIARALQQDEWMQTDSEESLGRLTMLAAESRLSRIWDTPEEDAAWKYLENKEEV